MRKIAVMTFSILLGTAVLVLPCYAEDIYGCYQKNNGQLRIVKSGDECRLSEVFIQWNAMGQQGPVGPQGVAGPPGPPYAAVHDQLRNVGIMFGQLAFMNSFPADAVNVLRCTGDTGGAIRVDLSQRRFVGIAFIGRDAISKSPVYHTAFKSDTLLDARSLLGSSVTINITAGGIQVNFSGVIDKAGLVAVENGVFIYALMVTQPMTLLEKQSGYRIWQDKDVPDIAKEVLQENGIPFSFQLTRVYDRRLFIMQYNETDLNFVSRLLEEEGIHYYSISSGTIVFSDTALNNGLLVEIPHYKGNLLGPGPGEVVVTGLYEAKGRPSASYSVDSYNFEKPALDLLGQAVSPVGGVGDVYEFSQAILEQNASKRRAGLGMDRSVVDAYQLTGTGNTPSFRAGNRVNIIDDTKGTFSGSYLLTGVDHVGVYDTKNDCVTYANHFEATDQITDYRPPRKTPVPKMSGLTTATVVGPAGNTRYVDKYGRIKVQFHWDHEGKFDEHSSGWIRVMIPAGKLDDTSLYIPLMGTEVVVGFLEGDPSLPIVLGSVYNYTHMPPVPLP